MELSHCWLIASSGGTWQQFSGRGFSYHFECDPLNYRCQWFDLRFSVCATSQVWSLSTRFITSGDILRNVCIVYFWWETYVFTWVPTILYWLFPFQHMPSILHGVQMTGFREQIKSNFKFMFYHNNEREMNHSYAKLVLAVSFSQSSFHWLYLSVQRKQIAGSG